MPKNNIKCFDVEKFRSYFPIFAQQVNGYPFIYFDSAATSQMPQSVSDAMSDYYLKYKSNVGRGVYTFAEQASAAYEQSRESVAAFIGAQPNNIVFTSGATASINLVATAWAYHTLQKGDEILVSIAEHHSNFLPWQQLAAVVGCVVRIMPLNQAGVIDVASLSGYITPKTKLICLFYTSNVVGSSNDIQVLCAVAKQQNIAVLVDACQTVAHQSIDVQTLGCDFLVFSGHKLFGPTGVGVLYVASRRIQQMRPSLFGGGMVVSVDQKSSSYKKFPHGFEAGTPNISGVIGTRAAIEFVAQNVNFDLLHEHEETLSVAMIQGLKKIDSVVIISTTYQPTSIVTFMTPKYHAHDIAAYLDSYGIAVRAGNHCVQMYHQSCVLDHDMHDSHENDHQCTIYATVRISFSGYNTLQEVEFCLKKLQELLK